MISRSTTHLALLLTSALALGACSSDPCEQAVKRAASVSEYQDTVEDLDPAITACGSLSELKSASAKHPKAFDGVDEKTFVKNRCKYNPSLQATAICKSIAE